MPLKSSRDSQPARQPARPWRRRGPSNQSDSFGMNECHVCLDGSFPNCTAVIPNVIYLTCTANLYQAVSHEIRLDALATRLRTEFFALEINHTRPTDAPTISPSVSSSAPRSTGRLHRLLQRRPIPCVSVHRDLEEEVFGLLIATVHSLRRTGARSPCRPASRGVVV